MGGGQKVQEPGGTMKKSTNIVNLTPHQVAIVTGATFDASIRKYRGGIVVKTIPSSGMVSAISSKQEEMDPIVTDDGVFIPTCSAPKWVWVDPLPEFPEGSMYIVSAMYVTACRELGIPTHRLLTVGPAVVGDDGHSIVGCVSLVRN